MKVICIKHGIYADNIAPRLEIGKVYTVIDQIQHENENVIYNFYILEEIGPEHGYGINNFIPLSDIDETEMIRNYQTEKA